MIYFWVSEKKWGRSRNYMVVFVVFMDVVGFLVVMVEVLVFEF